MGFAQPIMLAFLGLFIPVIALYLLKQRRRRVQVSTLLFWDKILKDEQTVTSLTRLKKILSLLLQLLFIALLTFALARPLMSDGLTGARRIVLFLDTSASMLVEEEEGSRFDLAREKALDVIKGMAQGDTLMLVSVNQHPEIVRPFTNSKRELEDAIEGLSPIHTETNFGAALELLDHLAPSERETHVYLITDGAFPTIDFTPQQSLQFAYLPVGQASDNIGITAFQVRPLPDSPHDFQIHLEVTNGTDAEVLTPMELLINGALTDAYELTLPPNESVTRLIRQFSGDGGTVEVFLDYEDAFGIDNRAFGRLRVPEPIDVQLVITGNLFLETALLTDRNVLLEIVGPNEVKPTEDFDLTIFASSPPSITPTGNSIFIHQWPEDLGIETLGELKSPLVTDWNREHPINRHLQLQNIGISQAKAVTLPDSFDVLVSSFGQALIGLQESDNRKVMVVAFDPLSSDLPLRVAFPIMIANAVRYLQGSDLTDSWLNPTIGQNFSSEELADFVPDTVEAIALERIILPDDQSFNFTESATLLRTDKVGLYQAGSNPTNAIPLLAVNLASPHESRIATSDTIPINSETPLKEITSGFRLGYEPWFFVALLAAVLSAAEWFLFHRRLIE